MKNGDPIGTVHPPRTMFLRVHAGEAELGREKYEMSYTMGGTPIIFSKQSGKWFTLSWQQILDLARTAGIDAEEKDEA